MEENSEEITAELEVLEEPDVTLTKESKSCSEPYDHASIHVSY